MVMIWPSLLTEVMGLPSDSARPVKSYVRCPFG